MTAKILAFAASLEESPILLNGQTPPKRVRNADVRTREYLTPDEVNALMKATKTMGRHSHRNETLILLAFRHGLRVSELVALRWDQIELKRGVLHVTRNKNGSPSTHPLRGPELRALRRVKRGYPEVPTCLTPIGKAP